MCEAQRRSTSMKLMEPLTRCWDYMKSLKILLSTRSKIVCTKMIAKENDNVRLPLLFQYYYTKVESNLRYAEWKKWLLEGKKLLLVERFEKIVRGVDSIGLGSYLNLPPPLPPPLLIPLSDRKYLLGLVVLMVGSLVNTTNSAWGWDD